MLTDQMNALEGKAPQTAAVSGLCPAGIFRPGAVLQRDRRLTIWGTAAPNAKVHCTLDGVTAVTYAGSRGDFAVKLPPRPAGSGLTLELTDGVSVCTIPDVAVGEVFLLAGQSNMAFDLAEVPGFQPEPDADIRLFRVEQAAIPGGVRDVSGKWQSVTEKAGFSAVGYFFAKKLRELRGVPVGLIDISRGGVGIETYIPEEELAADEIYGPLLEQYEAELHLPERNPEPSLQDIHGDGKLLRVVKEALRPLPPVPAELTGWEKPDFDDRLWQRQELPDSWAVAGHPHPGRFLYRKTLRLPAEWQNRELRLGLGAADRADRTFVNGRLIGSTGDPAELETWNTKRYYQIPAAVNNRELLTVAVEVSSLYSICTHGGLVGPAEEMFLELAGERLTLAGEWRLREAADTGCFPMLRMVHTGAGEVKSYHMIYDNAAAPLTRFELAGFLWYQGEANALVSPGTYGRLLKMLIRSWRRKWFRTKGPFLVFQLPGFQPERDCSPASPWAVIREEQLRATVEATGVPPVIMCDTGEVNNIHPVDKSIPGARAALMADALLDGRQPEAAAYAKSPFLNGDGTLSVKFILSGTPLTAKPGAACWGRTADGQLKKLPATVTGPDTIRLETAGAALTDIYYAWSENPAGAGLATADGLPVFPFHFQLP